jgi:hypothetical protein
VGKFIFENAIKVEIEDRALAHLQTVMVTKLRRGESFCFTWEDDASVGDGRTSVWLHPAANITFKFHGSRDPQLNPEWIHALGHVANTADGLSLVPEPPPHPKSRPILHESDRRGG